MTKKYLQKSIILIIIIALIMSLTNCTLIMEVLGMAEKELLRIRCVEDGPFTMALGTQARYEMEAIISDSHGQEDTKFLEDAAWSSNDESVCTVHLNEAGDEWYVYAEAEGSAVITVTKDSVSGTIAITVVEPLVGEFSISTSESATDFYVGTPQQLTATANGDGGDIPQNFDITSYIESWESSDETVVSIDTTGLATFHEPGTVEITGTLPISLLSDPGGQTSSNINNLTVIRTISANLDYSGTPDNPPLIFSALYDSTGSLAAMFPDGTRFNGGSLSIVMVSVMGDLFHHPYLNLATEASVTAGEYSFHAIIDVNSNGEIDPGTDLGIIDSVTAIRDYPAYAENEMDYLPLVAQTISVTGAGTVSDGAILTAYWLAEGSGTARQIISDTAHLISSYLFNSGTKPSDFPKGLRDLSFGTFTSGSVTTAAGTLIPGTYDVCITIDNDSDGYFTANKGDYLFYLNGITYTGGDRNISTEFTGENPIE
ncbi:MAG: hypothetical protein JEY99_05415 [Spirochaetales bacterium]|nr:hypothetical protein [Spirochaetales bacterium]